MKFKYIGLFLLCLMTFFLQGYKYKYNVEPLDATNNAATRNNQGIMYMEMGQYIPAMTEFKLAIALSPNAPASATYYNNLGIVYLKLGSYEAAQPCFEKAISLNSVFLEYYENLVNVYSKNGTLNSQLSKYQNQINANPNNSQAYFMAGLILKKQGKKAKAIEYLKKYIVLERDNVMARAAKQMIYDMSVK